MTEMYFSFFKHLLLSHLSSAAVKILDFVIKIIMSQNLSCSKLKNVTGKTHGC